VKLGCLLVFMLHNSLNLGNPECASFDSTLKTKNYLWGCSEILDIFRYSRL